ncbi:MAG: pentapeptide repeat-containing protein [Microcoleaceae cyanobacterium]
MKFNPLAILTITFGLIIPLPVVAENLAHTQQLLSTKQCPKCELSGAGLVLADLAGANLTGANLTRANLSRANLSGANLSGANLAGTSLHGANLTGANLTGANLTGTDLRDAYLTGAILTETPINNAQLLGVRGLPADIGSAVDFYRLGIQEAKAGNYVDAINYYNQAIGLEPRLAAAFFARSMAKADLGDLQGAFIDAKQAQELYQGLRSPEGVQVSTELVQVLEVRLNPDEDQPKGGFLGVLETAAPLLLRFLF